MIDKEYSIEKDSQQNLNIMYADLKARIVGGNKLFPLYFNETIPLYGNYSFDFDATVTTTLTYLWQCSKLITVTQEMNSNNTTSCNHLIGNLNNKITEFYTKFMEQGYHYKLSVSKECLIVRFFPIFV